MAQAYPEPDRSNFTPNFEKTPENEVIDIGWRDGDMSNGRPFRVEMWAENHVTLVSYFFSTLQLKDLSERQAADLLEREGVVRFTSGERPVSLRQIVDGSGNPMWSVTVAIGDEDNTFAINNVPLNPYVKEAGKTEPDTAS